MPKKRSRRKSTVNAAGNYTNGVIGRLKCWLAVIKLQDEATNKKNKKSLSDHLRNGQAKSGVTQARKVKVVIYQRL